MSNPAGAALETDSSHKPSRRRAAVVALRETFGSSTFWWAAAGCLLWRVSLPPIDWPLAAWAAPWPWLHLAMQPTLPGRRPYWSLYAAGVLYWCVALYWLVLPHWATGFGGAALCLYLGAYLPLFVAIVRAGRAARLPLPVIAPCAWIACEYLRAHLLTGFSMAELEHSQHAVTPLLQIVHLAGQYTLSGLMLFVAASLYVAVARVRVRPVAGTAWAASAATVMAAAWWYGAGVLAEDPGEPGPQVLLIQGVVDTKFDGDFERVKRGFERQVSLSAQAAEAHPDADLMAWPESMYPFGWYTHEGKEFDVEKRLSDAEAESWRSAAADRRRSIVDLAQGVGMPLLLNVSRHDVPSGRQFNCNLFFDELGRPVARYDKMHPVLLGEYIPLGEALPWLYRFSPLGGGLTPGRRATGFEAGGVRFCSSICYEKVLPHVIRRQVQQLRGDSREPQVLINLSNDGWFYGSTELDLHLICGVFRAAEQRKPLLIAANTGISASIDACGRVRARAAKRDETFVVDRPRLPQVRSPYLVIGDVPWQAATLLCGGLLTWTWGKRRRRRSCPAAAAATS